MACIKIQTLKGSIYIPCLAEENVFLGNYTPPVRLFIHSTPIERPTGTYQYAAETYTVSHYNTGLKVKDYEREQYKVYLDYFEDAMKYLSAKMKQMGDKEFFSYINSLEKINDDSKSIQKDLFD